MPSLKLGEGSGLQTQTEQIKDRTFEDLWKEAYIAVLHLKQRVFEGPPMYRIDVLIPEQEQLLKIPLTEIQRLWIKRFIKDEDGL